MARLQAIPVILAATLFAVTASSWASAPAASTATSPKACCCLADSDCPAGCCLKQPGDPAPSLPAVPVSRYDGWKDQLRQDQRGIPAVTVVTPTLLGAFTLQLRLMLLEPTAQGGRSLQQQHVRLQI